MKLKENLVWLEFLFLREFLLKIIYRMNGYLICSCYHYYADGEMEARKGN